MKVWRVDTPLQTLALASDGDIPRVIWWDTPLPQNEDLASAGRRHPLRPDRRHARRAPPLSLCPEATRGFAGQPGLVVAEADGTPLAPRFAFESAEERGEEGAELALHSVWEGLRLTHRIGPAPGGMLALRTELTADRPLRVSWLSAPVLPGPQEGTILTPSGRWIGEFQLDETPWAPGARVVEARQGPVRARIPALRAVSRRRHDQHPRHGTGPEFRLVGRSQAGGRSAAGRAATDPGGHGGRGRGGARDTFRDAAALCRLSAIPGSTASPSPTSG